MFLLTIVSFIIFGCGAKQDVFKINNGSNLSFNQEFPFLKEKNGDRKLEDVKFSNKFDSSGLLVSTNAALSATTSPGVLGAGLDWGMFGLGLASSVLENAFTIHISPSSYMWMPFYSETDIDYKKYHKELLSVLRKALLDTGIKEDDLVIDDYHIWLSSDYVIRVGTNKILKTKSGKEVKTPVYFATIQYKKGACNSDIKNTPYKDCLSGAYLYSMSNNKYLKEKYHIDKVAEELSKIKGQFIVDYSSNKVYAGGNVYDYIIKTDNMSVSSTH